jgi:putative CocE/NonD family hydrolase
MADGVRLAADLMLPRGVATDERFPVLLEYLPYRKDEGIGYRWGIYTYFARRGYVVARVDIRGTGQSEGTLPAYEYTDQELLDGVEVVAWLARQPWSNGKVGMWGISWGGFNSIQIAMRKPPALAAIIAIDATDDLYEDDIHLIDGGMHIDQYEVNQDLENAITASPDLPIDDASLATRFDTEPWILTKLRQQRDGPFWDRGSLNADYGKLEVPAFLIGGWYDGYRDSIPRMLERVDAPVKAMIGPWNHTFPHDAVPGPQMEWRHEAMRWWDYWLKGRDTGIMDEPAFAVWVRRWHQPDPGLAEIPGDWRWEDGWPLARGAEQTLFLGGDRSLTPVPPPVDRHRLRYVPTAGTAAGFWWGEIVGDQRPADAFSLLYETPPLEADLEILGMPAASLRVAADAPLAHWFVRLSDVAPDGTVTLVTGAGRNGAHRRSAEEPGALELDEPFDLAIDMHFTSWVFPRGHRIRMAISNALWPMIWPTPHPMTTSLDLGGAAGSRIVLPVVPAAARPRPAFLPPAPSEPYPPAIEDSGSAWPGTWVLERDELTGTSTVRWDGATETVYPWGRQRHRERLVYTANDSDPAVSTISGQTETSFALPGGELAWRGELSLSSDRAYFFYRYTRRLFADGALVRERAWEERVPRDFQ